MGTGTDDPRALRGELRKVVQSARDKVYPALVHIQLVTSRYSDGKEIKGQSVGSGTIISAEGHVLTNQHVVDDGHRFRCTLWDKQEISAELVGEDPLTDLAVLKLDLTELKDPKTPLPVASFGDSSKLQVGDMVLAMGSPFALSRAVTMGIVSNTERVFRTSFGRDEDDMYLERWQRTGMFTVWIQHDAVINPGNSGGPLVNLKGELVGVNELGGSQIGFAIPSNLAEQVASALVKDGCVYRSWIGTSFKSLKKTGLSEGVLINSVVEDSPADHAGLRPGDVIVELSGRPVTVRFPEQIPALLKRIADLKISSEVTVVYKRNGERQETTITSAKLEKDRGDEIAFRAWGLTAMEITPMMAREGRFDSTDGVLISGVRDAKSAALAKPPLDSGDIIKSIDGQTIKDLATFVTCYETIMAKDPLPEYVLIEFARGQTNNLTLLKPKPEEETPPAPEIPKPWIGVAVQPVLKELAKELAIEEHVGFRITRVYPRTKAAESELKVGDVITQLNGKRLKPLRIEDAGMFQRAVKRLDIDDETAEVTVVRSGKPQKVNVTLEQTRLTPEEAETERNRDFEITVREVTFFDRVDNRWEQNTNGVIVTQVERAGWAGLGGLRPGDLIQRIDQSDVTDLASYREAIKTITQRKPERVIFFVLRGVRTRFLYVEPEWTVTYEKKTKKENK